MSDTTTLINFTIYDLAKQHSLSRRVINSCLNSGLVTLFAILNYYLKHGNFTYLRRCGAKSNTELSNMCAMYVSKYQINQETLKISNSDQLFDEFKIFIHTYFGIDSLTIEKFRESYLQKKFTLFNFIFLILENTLNEKEFYIFLHNYGFVNNFEKISYQTIGNTFSITRERARQIFKDLPKIIIKKLTRLSNSCIPPKTLISQYDDVNNLPDYYKITNEFVDKINSKEKINVSAKFCCFVLSLISNNDYLMIQNIEKNYNCYYSISKTYSDKVHLNVLFSQLENYSSLRRHLDIKINVSELISNNLNYSGSDITNNVILHKFICDVASSCFDFSYDDDFQTIIVPRNTNTRISEYILEILSSANTPMTLYEIYAELSKKSEKKHSFESLRSSILNTDNVVAIGKTSTYALSSWRHVNTKKIKDIVYDFLIKNPGKSFTINEIAEYVIQFRNTNSKNIRTNLKLDKTGKFIFDKDNKVSVNI